MLERGSWMGGLVVVVTAVAFLPVLWAGWVWDDNLLVVANSLTGSWSNLGTFFQIDLWESSPKPVGRTGYYRPLMLLSLTVDRLLLGPQPGLHHLHSLAWHLTAVAMLFALLRQLGIRVLAAAVGTAIFALHPVQVEAVAFISARNDPMATAGLLGVLVLLMRPAPSVWTGALAAVGIACAALCKESVLLAPLLLLLLRWAHRPAAPMARSRALTALYLPLGLGLLAYGLLRLWAGVGRPPSVSIASLMAVIGPSVQLYAAELLRTEAIPGVHFGWRPSGSWLPVLVLVALSWAACRAGRRLAVAGLGVAVLGFVPSLIAIAATGVPAHRYLYLSMVGVAILMASAVESLPRIRCVDPCLVALGIVVWGGLLHVPPTVALWRDDATLWAAAVEAHPSPYTWGIQAKVLEDLGDLDGAAEGYHLAVSAPTPFFESCFNVAAVHLRRGDPESAAREGQRALDNGCQPSAELLSPTAVGLAVTGRWDAAEELASGVEQDPTGRAVLVRVGAAARRGDLQPLLAAQSAHPELPARSLAKQVAHLLTMAGEETVAAQVLGAH